MPYFRTSILSFKDGFTMLDYAMVGMRRWPDSESRKSMVAFLQNEAGSVVVVLQFPVAANPSF